MNNKFLLFIGAQYYPQGGAEDLHGVYSSVQDAVNAASKYFQGEKEANILIGDFWAQVYELEKEEICWKVEITQLPDNKFRIETEGYYSFGIEI